MKGARSAATLTLAWGCVTLGACQLVGGITDRTLERDDGASADRLPSDDHQETTAAATTPATRRRAPRGRDAPGDDGGDDGEAAASGCLTNAECTALATAAGPSGTRGGDAAPFNGTLDGGSRPRRLCPVDRPVRPAAHAGLPRDLRRLPERQFDRARHDLQYDRVARGLQHPETASRPFSPRRRSTPAFPAGASLRPRWRSRAPAPGRRVRSDRQPHSRCIPPGHRPPRPGGRRTERRGRLAQHHPAGLRGAGMLLMTPTVPIDPVTNLMDQGLTWRDVPSDRQRAPLYADQISGALHPAPVRPRRDLKLAVVVRNDALGAARSTPSATCSSAARRSAAPGPTSASTSTRSPTPPRRRTSRPSTRRRSYPISSSSLPRRQSAVSSFRSSRS